MRLFLFCVWLLVSACSDGAYAPTNLGSSGADENAPVDLSVRESNFAWAQSCAERLSPTATREIHDYMRELCRKPDFYYGNPRNFQLNNRDHQLGLAYKIHFRILGAPDRVNALNWLEQARSCLPAMQAVWQRYGVRLEIPMDSDFHPSSEGAHLPVQEVELGGEGGRSHALRFHLREGDAFCKMMIHEIGHHFGLEDEYVDPDCPNRPFISTERSPFSLMANISETWNQLDFFPRHLRSIFGEFCGEVPTATFSRLRDEPWVNLGPPPAPR